MAVAVVVPIIGVVLGPGNRFAVAASGAAGAMRFECQGAGRGIA